MPESESDHRERLLGSPGTHGPNDGDDSSQDRDALLTMPSDQEQGEPLWPAPGGKSSGRWPSRITKLWTVRRPAWRPALVPIATVLTAMAVVAALFRLLDTSTLDALGRGPSPLTYTPLDDGKAHDRDPVIFLHPDAHIHRAAATVHVAWNITKARIAPDGVVRDNVIHINGQFPGPTLEARTGDTFIITVVNAIDEPVSLHWHGLHMRGANDMDGPVGVNQCAIPPGGSFVYRVPTGDQAGTFWYHAHSELQRADGLYGGLVIHAPAPEDDSIRHGYSKEILLLIGDWYHFPGQHVYSIFQDPSGDGQEPVPGSVLVNGMGTYDCRLAVKSAPVDCHAAAMPWLVLDKTVRYRARIVNVGSLTGISTTIADATMTTIHVDGGLPIVGREANSVGVVYPAQRVDYILSWPEAAAQQSDTELLISVDGEYYVGDWQDPPDRTIRIESASRRATADTKKTPAVVRDIVTFDLRQARGLRLDADLPPPDKTYMIFAVVEILSHNHFVPKSYINHTMWVAQAQPLLALDRALWDSHQLVPWTGSSADGSASWVELTINNIDTQGHPFHLHGFDFYVVAAYEGLGGWDYYNPFAVPWKPPRGGAVNTRDPLRRDTVYVPPYGYAILRFRADNEGLWVLHCHILWHQASGMSMAFQVMGDASGLSGSAAGRRAGEYCKARE